MLSVVQNRLTYDPAELPAELRELLATLAEEYPLSAQADENARRVRYVPAAGGEGRIVRAGREATVHYTSLAQAARFTGTLLAGLPEAGEYRETCPFSTFGALICAAHGKVFTVEQVQRWLRRLALMGYNLAMLYTDDTYEVPGEPFFGYLRGRYTAEELGAIDAYAARLGIELVPAIQALGHLTQLFQWPAYRAVADTKSVILANEPKSYELIEKMILAWKQATRCRRIHLGMDEAHDLGRGVFLDRHGYERGFEIFNRHLAKVVEICARHGLKPLIWSDMYFKLGSPTGQDYYSKDIRIPDEVKAQIPAAAQLVYWDYYHADPEFYRDWIARHRALAGEPMMASGVWNWGTFWHHAANTEKNAGACIEACRQTQLAELVFATWGDDGSYCDFDSALAGLAWCADKAFAPADPQPEVLEKRFAAVCGASYMALRLASELESGPLATAGIMWDYPLYNVYLHNARSVRRIDLRAEAERFERLAADLAMFAEDRAAGDLDHARRLAGYLALRLRLGEELATAWAAQDRTALAGVRDRLPEVVRLTEEVGLSFRRQWLTRCKPFGLEVIQLRLAGVAEGYRELARRLGEFLAGDCATLPELDANLNPPAGEVGGHKFSHLFTPSVDFRM